MIISVRIKVTVNHVGIQKVLTFFNDFVHNSPGRSTWPGPHYAGQGLEARPDGPI